METKLTLELPSKVLQYAEEITKLEALEYSQNREWAIDRFKELIAYEVIKVLNLK